MTEAVTRAANRRSHLGLQARRRSPTTRREKRFTLGNGGDTGEICRVVRAVRAFPGVVKEVRHSGSTTHAHRVHHAELPHTRADLAEGSPDPEARRSADLR